jgi:hypothetical protein
VLCYRTPLSVSRAKCGLLPNSLGIYPSICRCRCAKHFARFQQTSSDPNTIKAIQNLALLYVEYKLDGNYMATGLETVNHSDDLRQRFLAREAAAYAEPLSCGRGGAVNGCAVRVQHLVARLARRFKRREQALKLTDICKRPSYFIQ